MFYNRIQFFFWSLFFVDQQKGVIASKLLLLEVSNEIVNATINMLTTVRRKGKKRKNQPSY
jgi:hypothetical protein